ncbi:ribonuclease P protein component 4 [Methanosalsum natronophilum]|uniref:ribonuclease P protein component 4 n=1 Tax=Methanosalsum natronophilum TaxID=768733 RepID=UPI002166D82F|nr:ribonuclease P protein component 4 [Methanosalsum natronophilum]MCS3923488.1 ribonuclease P protein subunit RPR2 [Methanosalsum natronophilum]
MGKKKLKKKYLMKDLAHQRISILFKLADAEYQSNPHRSNRYVELARKIGMRYRISIPPDLRKRACRKCNSYLVPGNNCRVRIHKNYVLITCEKCERRMRYPVNSD